MEGFEPAMPDCRFQGELMFAVLISDPLAVSLIYGAGAFMLGACVGSFLNVVIHRVPRDMTVNKPKRSFCPFCKKPIPWYQNIPLFSWVVLRGKCAECGAKIAFRYVLVELITALFFILIWIYFPWQIALIYWILISLLIAATFIDLEHYIIPDGITIGGAIVGLGCAFIVPQLFGEVSHVRSLGQSALGAVVGYGSLWAVVHLGKLLFGRLKESFEEPVPWSITQGEGEEEPVFRLGEESTLWSEFFFRPSDRMVMECPRIKVKSKEHRDVTARIFYDRVEVGDQKISLEDLDSLEGDATEVVIPREAMGFGDVKFMALIGAFLGWRAVIFTVLAGSLAGAIVGLTARITGKQEWSSKIPFGPFLALGAVIWMFYGWIILRWYLLKVMG